MRIIKKAALVEFWDKHPESETALMRWYQLATDAHWLDLNAVKETFPHADQVTVRS